jgi:hypothetical protein
MYLAANSVCLSVSHLFLSLYPNLMPPPPPCCCCCMNI